uniref:Uncharacterized protein n=1 Tax=Klebsiella pneumoniae TaxID=573 RepID=A0A8B0SSE7_KLEPN|nr:hypothetical protein [Klebsiella pneumoniae]
MISSINYSIPRCSNDASMQRGKCEKQNVQQEEKRHRRRGRLIHITDDSYINSRMLDQISDDVMY